MNLAPSLKWSMGILAGILGLMALMGLAQGVDTSTVGIMVLIGAGILGVPVFGVVWFAQSSVRWIEEQLTDAAAAIGGTKVSTNRLGGRVLKIPTEHRFAHVHLGPPPLLGYSGGTYVHCFMDVSLSVRGRIPLDEVEAARELQQWLPDRGIPPATGDAEGPARAPGTSSSPTTGHRQLKPRPRGRWHGPVRLWGAPPRIQRRRPVDDVVFWPGQRRPRTRERTTRAHEDR